MVDNTQRANTAPVNSAQDQTTNTDSSSSRVRRVSNTTLVLATLGVGLAIALIAAGVVTLPLSGIAGVVCIALGISIGVTAGAKLITACCQSSKKTEQEIPAAPIEPQTPATKKPADVMPAPAPTVLADLTPPPTPVIPADMIPAPAAPTVPADVTPAPIPVIPADVIPAPTAPENVLPSAPSSPTPSRLSRISAQAELPEELLGIQSKELQSLKEDDPLGKIIKEQIAEKIIEKNNISPALKDHVSEQLNIYTDDRRQDYYLDVTANGECFYRCALIALTKNYIYALSEPSALLVDETNIFSLFENKTGLNLSDNFQMALIGANQAYEGSGLTLSSEYIDIRPHLHFLHEPVLMHQVLFSNSVLYQYGAGAPESSQQLHASLMLLLSQMDGIYDSCLIDAWLDSNELFSGNSIDLQRFHDDLKQVHRELQYTTTACDNYFTLLSEQLPASIAARMNLMTSSNHYLYRLGPDDINIPAQEEEPAEADSDNFLDTKL